MRICCAGDNVVDRYPDRGVMYPGGNAVNVAVHVRRQGMDSAYVGAVGDDDAGRLVLGSLRTEGVDTSHARVLPGGNAYATVRLVDGNRVFGGGSIGVSRFELTGEDLAYLAGFDLVHTGDCSMLEDQVARIAEVAPVSFDFSVRSREYAEPLLPHVRIATFSVHESADVDELVRWAHSRGTEIVAVTRGAAGSVVSDGTAVHVQPAVPTEVVDTLGAGDSYISGLLVALLRGATAPQAAAAAAAYAARVCASYGAFGYEALDRMPPHVGAEAGHVWPDAVPATS